MSSTDSRTRDCLALIFASFFPLAMTFIYFVVLHDPQDKANPLFMTAFTSGKIVQFLFPLAYVWWFEREQIRLAWPTRNGIALGAGFGLAVAASMFLLFYLVVRHIPAVAEDSPRMIYERLVQFQARTPARFLLLAIYICIPHSLWEEYYWRWFVFGWMRRYMPVSAAIALSSIAFMLHHVVILVVYFPGNTWTLAVPFSLGVAIGGAVWAWLYERTGSLYAPWLSHALIDAAIMAIGFWMLREYWN